MDSCGVFSLEALRPHLSMGLPLYVEKSRGKRAYGLGTASRSEFLQRTKVKSDVSPMSYVTFPVCDRRHRATIRPTRHRLAKRRTRREAGSQNHGSPVSGTTAGLPNQIQRTTNCSQELAAMRRGYGSPFFTSHERKNIPRHIVGRCAQLLRRGEGVGRQQDPGYQSPEPAAARLLHARSVPVPVHEVRRSAQRR